MGGRRPGGLGPGRGADGGPGAAAGADICTYMCVCVCTYIYIYIHIFLLLIIVIKLTIILIFIIILIRWLQQARRRHIQHRARPTLTTYNLGMTFFLPAVGQGQHWLLTTTTCKYDLRMPNTDDDAIQLILMLVTSTHHYRRLWQKHSFHASSCPAIQRQKPPSPPDLVRWQLASPSERFSGGVLFKGHWYWSMVREEQWETCRGGQTTQKAKMYLGDFWTPQPEQVLTFSLVKYHSEVGSQAQMSLRSSGYSSPHLAPCSASRQHWPPEDEFTYSVVIKACEQTANLQEAATPDARRSKCV